jgi:rhamnose transport system ATP-binding protein
MGEHNPVLQVADIWKSFPGVQALQSIDLSVFPGEIHALLGENGSGKSTLMKIMAGVYRPDRGVVFVDGSAMQTWTPAVSQQHGISPIYQELSLFPDLSVSENLFLRQGQFIKRGIVRWKYIEQQTRVLLDYLKSGSIDPRAKVESLSVAERQIVEIVKALAGTRARVLLMDEPTSALSLEEVGNLISVMRQLRQDGVGIIFISHKLEEVIRVADRITVLRDGQHIESGPASDFTEDSLVRLMIGRDIKHVGPRESHATGERILEVRNIGRRGIFREISFSLEKGEILGFFGLVGSRRTDVVESLFGIGPVETGTILVDGRSVRMTGTHRSLACGIGLIPEDRGTEGLILSMNLAENITLPDLEKTFPSRMINRRQEAGIAENICEELDVKFGSIRDLVDSLSGGNKQKIVLAKWLLRKARILIFDEPTKGIDVGAKEIIHHLMDDLSRKGVGIIMVSSELPEILKMSDRICVMAKGRIVGQFDAADATQERIMRCASEIAG